MAMGRLSRREFLVAAAAGYRAMPSGGGPFPIVLVVQEIFGVHEYIRDVCRRLAKHGYLAVAPNLSTSGKAT